MHLRSTVSAAFPADAAAGWPGGAAAADGSARRLPGDLSIWIIIAVEMATFALMFGAYAVARALHLAEFSALQRTLDASRGLLNTWLLIGGSGCVVQAVAAVGRGAPRRGLAWLAGAQGCGLAFVVFKVLEYRAKAAAGIDLDTHSFYTLYFLLTGFHLAHVLAAMVFLGLLMAGVARGRFGPGRLHGLETGAAFWHMVDLLWLVLFPLLYLVR